MAKKGQTYKHYPESLKREAIRLRVEENWSYRAITEQLGIYDANRVKKWMATYRKKGDRVFEDHRGASSRQETEQSRYVKRLEMENAVLKKWLAILNQEVSGESGSLSNRLLESIPSKECVRS
ncbi:transposase [Paenibacillus gorillae]|uniref:transposase n=1 Tax=Paenibacillus gorillae TaxID=1243662 RepID=UPI0005A7CE68|nr:transposase [Paenibacillus gorillae]